MVTKIKKSIDNSKRKGDFKKRQQMRIEKKHRQKNADKMEFVDRRELIKSKKKDKKERKGDKTKNVAATIAAAEEEDEELFDEFTRSTESTEEVDYGKDHPFEILPYIFT